MDNQVSKIRIAVLFERLGPYHHARLTAAGKLMEVHGVESCGMDKFYAWDKIEGGDSFHRVTLTGNSEHNRQWRRKLQKQMLESLDRINPDVVAIPGWSFVNALAALRWCMSRRKPVVVMSDSISGDAPRASWKQVVKRQLIKLCSSALVAGTPHAEYLKTLGMSPDRIFLGYDAVDNEYFEQSAKEARSNRDALRVKHNLPEKYFLVPARFIWEKNLQRLIQAYALYRKRNEALKPEAKIDPSGLRSQVSSLDQASSPPWNLVLLGDGSLLSGLKSQVSSLGLEDSVLLPGFKQYPDLPTYYGLASAMILPSISETWGLVVNEAMASGLPVLVSNRCGCAKDLVQEGVNGFTFDPYDVDQLAGLMLKLSHSLFPISNYGEASRAIIANWGPERFANGLMQAADAALRAGPVKPTLIQKILLRALLCR